MDKLENLEYWLAKFYLNLSIISQDIDIERISLNLIMSKHKLCLMTVGAPK